MFLRSLEENPRLADFTNAVRGEEDALEWIRVRICDLELDPAGNLAVNVQDGQRSYTLAKEAFTDLANLGGIPEGYFHDCDPELQAISFNRRRSARQSPDEQIQLTVEGEQIHRIRKAKLLPTKRAPVLDTIVNTIPSGVPKEEVRAVRHAWNGVFDVSAIAPTYTCEPRPGDTVAFGVSIRGSEDGAVQIQGAAFRCICRNGAINRVCDGREHRIRRPINEPQRERQFLDRIAHFARDAWDQWNLHAEALCGLNGTALGEGQHLSLRSRLRQRPFFLLNRSVDRVLDRLRVEASQHSGEPSLYDLWNALTFVGTHDSNISDCQSTRLRMAAGEFGRQRSRFCNACRQLILP